MKETLTSILNFINTANEAISKHNSMVNNLSNEKKILTNQIWRFLIEEIKTELTKYKTQKDSIEKAISGIQEKINKSNKEKQQKENEVKILEKQTTSIQPTIDEINSLLKQFGFSSFTLAKSASGMRRQLKIVPIGLLQTLSRFGGRHNWPMIFWVPTVQPSPNPANNMAWPTTPI